MYITATWFRLVTCNIFLLFLLFDWQTFLWCFVNDYVYNCEMSDKYIASFVSVIWQVKYRLLFGLGEKLCFEWFYVHKTQCFVNDYVYNHEMSDKYITFFVSVFWQGHAFGWCFLKSLHDFFHNVIKGFCQWLWFFIMLGAMTCI